MTAYNRSQRTARFPVNTRESETQTGAATFTSLPIPETYATLPQNDLDVSVCDVAYLYDAFARDARHGSTTVPTRRRRAP